MFLLRYAGICLLTGLVLLCCLFTQFVLAQTLQVQESPISIVSGQLSVRVQESEKRDDLNLFYQEFEVYQQSYALIYSS